MIGPILVRGTNWIGDAVLTTPALTLLGQAFPTARIEVLARPWVRDIYAGHPAVAAVIDYPASARPARPLGFVRLLAALRRRRFETAVLFQNAFEAALIAFLAGIPRRVGFATDGRGFLLTDPAVRPAGPPRHQSHDYVEALASLGIAGPPPPPVFRPGPAAAARAAQLAAPLSGRPGARLAMHIGAFYGQAKCWPAERFAELARHLAAEHGATIVVVGGPAEADAAARLLADLTPAPLIVAGRAELAVQAAVIAGCDLMVANDSGPMHVAAALGVPVVAVFGPTDPEATGPLGPGHVVIRHPVECAPCTARRCPREHQCMTAVSVTEVAEAALGLLAARPAGPAGREAQR